MNTVATIFIHDLTVEQILDLPGQFANTAAFPTLVRMSTATQPGDWTFPLSAEYSTLQQQWLAESSLSLESPDQRIVFNFVKTYCIVDGWLSFHRFLYGGTEWQASQDLYRALCHEVADQLGVTNVLHTGFSAVPWYTLETTVLDIEGLVKVIKPQCGCAIDDFETLALYSIEG